MKNISPHISYREGVLSNTATRLNIDNIPASRLLQKIENMNNLFYSTEVSNWGRLALLSGWSDWDLGIEESQGLLGNEVYNKRKKKGKILKN